jgi:hypothetical protein
MAASRTSTISVALLGAGCLLLGACRQSHDAPPTVEDLMQDRVALDGILMKCNDQAHRDKAGSDCEIARVAAERLAAEKESNEIASRQRDFELNRDKLRQSDEQRKAAQSAQKKFDPYTLPVVPVEPAPRAASKADSPP